jgi:hypothetical protein
VNKEIDRGILFLFLACFKAGDKHKAYRIKAQTYVEEEKSLGEDFRHDVFRRQQGFEFHEIAHSKRA